MKEEALVLTDMFGRKMQPIEWLQYIADSFMGLAELWEEYDSDYFEDEFESYKEECPDIGKIEMYEGIAHSIGEGLLHTYYLESVSTIAEMVGANNKKYLLKAFEESVVFASIIDAIGTIECVMNEANSANGQFYYYQYYCVVSTPEEAEECFGEGAAKRYKKNPKLTLDDYESAFEHITELLEKIKEGRFIQKLKASAWRIKAYCKLKAESPETYVQREAQIAKRFDQAYRSYEYAEKKLTETGSVQKVVTDRQAYDYLREHGFKGADDYRLPNFDTWQRYVRRGRSKHGTQKNTPRAGREYGRSVVKSDQIQSLSEISSQYTEEDK